MTVIELPDEEAAALNAKAAAQGLTLVQWMRELATSRTEQEAGANRQPEELPVLHLGAIGPLHRRDIYDDAY